jgi:hypothetical protein
MLVNYRRLELPCSLSDWLNTVCDQPKVKLLNVEDGGKRKFIMVQLPEICSEGKEAANGGDADICEIGKERIRRARAKIKADNAQATIGGGNIDDLDIGFRVLKLDSSNMKDVYYTPQKYAQAQFSFDGLVDNIKSDAHQRICCSKSCSTSAYRFQVKSKSRLLRTRLPTR